MLIYNLTIKIEWTIQLQWLSWIKEVYAENVIKTGCFARYKLLRLLDIDEDEGPTYALQLYTENHEKHLVYVREYQQQLDVLAYEKWGSSMLSFGTLMEILE